MDPETGTDEGAGLAPSRKWVVFLISVVCVGILIGLVFFSMSLPSCEEPPNSWAPCVGP
ncbi:hypothetical protein ACFQQD_01635 [Citricoccus sp. GCM10030269]